jgi:hypothetical protein
MSLRLIKPGLLAASSVLRHPHTGDLLQPLGYTKRGAPIWPVLGASEDDKGGTGDAGEGDAGAGNDDNKDGAGNKPDHHDETPEGLKARIAALEEEKNRHYSKRSAAERELEELRKFKAELENASKSDLEKAQAAEKAASDALLKAQNDMKDLRLQNAFLASNEITWHNPEEALRLADLSEVGVDADGKVDSKALKAALTNLANKSKHLVKPAGDDGDEDSNNGAGSGSGSVMNGQRKGDKGKGDKPPTREELAKKFPALNAIQ